MKKQGYKSRLSESLGEKHKGPHKQSMKAREHESEAMEKKHGKGMFAGDKSMKSSCGMGKKKMCK